jgi:hypothetical protein
METIELRIRLNFSQPLSHDDLQQIVDQAHDLIESESQEGGALSIDDNEIFDFELQHERIDDDS